MSQTNATRQFFPITISVGQTESDIIDFQNTTLVGLDIPTNFSGTSITLKASISLNGTYRNVPDGNGDAITIDITPNTLVPFVGADFFATQFVKLVSNISQSGSDCTLTAIGIPLYGNS
jgi:hypothetical protein